MRTNKTSLKAAEIIKPAEIFGFGTTVIKETGATARACCKADEVTVKELMNQYKVAETLEEKKLILDSADKISERTHETEREYRAFTLKLTGGVIATILAIYGIKTYIPFNGSINLLNTTA